MKFEMTREGCVLATDYLKKVDQYDAFMRNGWSVDGFSLIAWANPKLTGAHSASSEE